jgi:uncharacterized protein (DUF952 family)
MVLARGDASNKHYIKPIKIIILHLIYSLASKLRSECAEGGLTFKHLPWLFKMKAVLVTLPFWCNREQIQDKGVPRSSGNSMIRTPFLFSKNA